MDLDDLEQADKLVSHVEGGGTFASFAQENGVERKTISRRLAKMPALKLRVDAARHVAQTIARKAPRVMAPASTPSSGLSSLPSREEFVAKLWEIAQDKEHRGCPKALHILAEVLLAPEIIARRAQAELEAAPQANPSTGPTYVEIPPNGTEAPKRRAVIDAEVVTT